jgi:hypothetical protein
MWMFNFASAFFGVPSFVGFLVAAAFGAFIGGDPLRLYWRTQHRRMAVERVARPESFPIPQPSR